MRYIKEKSNIQIEINKSIFIALFYPLESKDDVGFYIEETKKAYPKANHYCSASIFGMNGEHQTASDDGEPSRTAGIPILEVLKHHDVTNILCVVVRFFGGVKLGSGGLLRAYTKAPADLMKQTKFYEKKMVPVYQIEFDYALIIQMDQYFDKKATIQEKTFLETVTYKLSLLEENDTLISDIEYQLKSLKQLNNEILWIEA